MHKSLFLRVEREQDLASVFHINATAFDTTAEANLVDALREHGAATISLVAEIDGYVVGHILFSPVTLSGHPQLKLAGLAPMAVLPEFQRQRIGTALVTAGLERCREDGYDAVVVLGHPEFYPRFGFVPAHRFGICCEYDVPADVFMIAELRSGALDGVAGTIHYHPAFHDL
ncbi:MAG: N-acetyltransferase [Planctomycetota bacterium]|nr:N-acetyltransferase [Planctomycetota bacterium]MDA1211681.1 N-acetyltransferase [Planctomycetota bacterium]